MTVRSLTVALRADASQMPADMQRGLQAQQEYANQTAIINRRLADAQNAQQAQLARAAEVAGKSGAMDSQYVQKTRQHMQEQLDFYRKLSERAELSESMRAKAREKYVALSQAMETTAVEKTAQQEQQLVAVTRAAVDARIAEEKRLLNERLAAAQEVGQAEAAAVEVRAAGGGMGGYAEGPEVHKFFGRRSPLMHGVRFGAEMAGWQVSPEIGMGASLIAHSEMFGGMAGPAAGVIAAGAALMLLYRSETEALERSRKALEEFHTSVEKAAKSAEDLRTWEEKRATGSSPGDIYRDKATEYWNQQHAAAEEIRKTAKSLSGSIAHPREKMQREGMLHHADFMEWASQDTIDRLNQQADELDNKVGAIEAKLTWNKVAEINLQHQPGGDIEQRLANEQKLFDLAQERTRLEAERQNAIHPKSVDMEALEHIQKAEAAAEKRRQDMEREKDWESKADAETREQERQDAEEKRADAERLARQQAIADIAQRLTDETRLATGAVSELQLGWEKLAKHLVDDLQVPGEQLEELYGKYLEAAEAREQEQAQKKAAHEAEQRQRQLEAFAQNQIERQKSPMQRYNDLKGRLEEAQKAGLMTADQVRQSEIAELTAMLGGRGRASAGGFSDAASHWRQIQTSLIQGDNIPKEQRDLMKDVKAELVKLNANGVTLKN